MTPSLFGDIDKEPLAIISPCGLYRYTLRRAARVHSNGGVVNFIMLNPSTADATTDDPTIRRCVGYARAWDYEDLVVTNLFAFRATDPEAMKRTLDPVGPENDFHLLEQARRAATVVCAWGGHGTHWRRGEIVLSLLRKEGVRPHCLKMTSVARQPAHPLYLPGELKPLPMAEGRYARP